MNKYRLVNEKGEEVFVKASSMGDAFYKNRNKYSKPNPKLVLIELVKKEETFTDKTIRWLSNL